MKNQIKRQPGRDINDIILTLVFLAVFALTSGYYILTSNVASLKIHPNDASVQNAIRQSLVILEGTNDGK